MYPKSLDSLIEAMKVLPGVGQKTAERYALHLLESSQKDNKDLAEFILASKLNTTYCKTCGNFCEGDTCDICLDYTRDKSLICVVATPKEVIAIEKMNDYNGIYHVLGGLISTKKGILPDDLNIDTLIDKAINTKEVILALNATVEGEMTSLYLAKKLQDTTQVTRLAFGLPIGGHLDYADDMTLIKAFEGRRKVE